MKNLGNKKLIVIGVGNELRGDDATGVIVAREIEKKKLPGVRTTIESGEGMALIEAWQDADGAVIVDACRSGAGAGKIFRFDARKQKLPEAFFVYSTHAFSVAGAVELARVLDRLPPRLIVYAIEGKNFAIGEGLSTEIKRAIESVCQSIGAEIGRLMEADPPGAGKIEMKENFIFDGSDRRGKDFG